MTRSPAFAVVFRLRSGTFPAMSLNRSEQMIFDYLKSHPDERHYWIAKVQKTAGAAVDEATATARLESELWRYFEERSGVAAPFKEAARREGLRRTSMKNLAEHLLRLWVAPRPKKQAAEERRDE
jgi:hypothetical protein